MINLRKLTQSKANNLVREVSQSEGIAEATQMYGNKTFQEANAGSKAFAGYLSIGAQIASAVSASSFFYYKIALPALPFDVPYLKEGIAILLSFFALSILEILKKHLFSALFVSFYKSKSKAVSFKVWLIPICMVLTAISVYTSFEGARLFVSQSDKSDTIGEDYSKQIAEIEAQEKDFKKSISWKGKIDTYNRTNAKILAGFQDRKTALHQEKDKVIGTHQGDIEGKGYSVAIFSLFMELLAIACFWFVCYVNFYTFIESKTVAGPTDSNEEQIQMIEKVISGVPNANVAPSSRKLGFQLGNNNNISQYDNRNAIVTTKEKEFVMLICKNPKCGKEYERKTVWQKYCCEDCRNEVNGFVPKKRKTKKGAK